MRVFVGVGAGVCAGPNMYMYVLGHVRTAPAAGWTVSQHVLGVYQDACCFLIKNACSENAFDAGFSGQRIESSYSHLAHCCGAAGSGRWSPLGHHSCARGHGRTVGHAGGCHAAGLRSGRSHGLLVSQGERHGAGSACSRSRLESTQTKVSDRAGVKPLFWIRRSA